MDNNIKALLYDILQSINEIESYYDNRSRVFEEFISDTRTKRAIERNVEIIGEAVNRILKRDKKFKLDNAERLVRSRNTIIHGYDNISNEFVWSLVINHLPKLKKEVVEILGEL